MANRPNEQRRQARIAAHNNMRARVDNAARAVSKGADPRKMDERTQRGIRETEVQLVQEMHASAQNHRARARNQNAAARQRNQAAHSKRSR